MNLYFTTFRTRFGLFSAALNLDRAIVATAFGDLEALKRRIRREATWTSDETRTAGLREQLRCYEQDPSFAFDLPLEPEGSDFQQRVWAELRRITSGTTSTYGRLATALHSSPRAVGRANATNPICLIVPCHRVIGSDGSLTGFAFGEPLKAALLKHEGALQPAASAHRLPTLA